MVKTILDDHYKKMCELKADINKLCTAVTQLSSIVEEHENSIEDIDGHFERILAVIEKG